MLAYTVPEGRICRAPFFQGNGLRLKAGVVPHSLLTVFLSPSSTHSGPPSVAQWPIRRFQGCKDLPA